MRLSSHDKKKEKIIVIAQNCRTSEAGREIRTMERQERSDGRVEWGETEEKKGGRCAGLKPDKLVKPLSHRKARVWEISTKSWYPPQ